MDFTVMGWDKIVPQQNSKKIIHGIIRNMIPTPCLSVKTLHSLTNKWYKHNSNMANQIKGQTSNTLSMFLRQISA